MSKNCIITTVKSKIKGNATSYIEKENEIFIPVSNKFSLKQTRAIAQDKVNSINKEYLSEKFGEVVSLNTSYTNGTGINIHPPQLLIDAYEVKEGNKTLEEINSNRDLEYFNGDEALLEQEQNEDNLIQKELDNLIEQTNNIEEKNDTYFSITPEVDFNLRATQILSSQKANQVFEKGKKAGWTLDKILTELQIPKEQKQLLLELGITDREQIISNTQVKPGVSELFESNPELANAVYEALGFNNGIEAATMPFSPDNPEAIVYGIGLNGDLIGEILVDDEGRISSSIGQAGVELYEEYRGKGYGVQSYLAVARELAKQNKTLKSEAFGKDNINEAASKVWKSLIKQGYAVDKGDYYEITNLFTLQQKQEAQKLYSQYLDTKQPDVILPIGTSGSGKSTFIKSLPQENLVVIEPDAMRVEFTGNMNDKSKDKEIYIEAAKRAIKAIKQGKQVVFDTTNLTKDKRLPFIEAIKKEIPTANIQYKLMELNPELAKQRIKAQIERGENRAVVSDETIDRHAASYKQMLEDIKNEPITEYKDLGSKTDIQGFKEFVQGKQFQNLTAEEKARTIEQVTESLNKLNTHLENYLKQFGFNTEQLDNLRQVSGYSIIGATDFLEKTIFVQKANIDKAYTKEAAYAIFNLLGRKNLLRKDLIASIHLIDNYDNLKSKYINSKLSDYQIRELIAIDYLQQKLIEAHKEVLPSTNKAISKDVTAKNKLEYTILKIKQWWSNIVRKFFKTYKKGYIENVFNQIANDTINNNTRLFNLSNKVSYKKMELTGKQKQINDNLVKLGAINSGSYALNRQGNLTRDNINDLDYFLPYQIKDDFIKNVVKKYPQAIFSKPYSGVMGNRSLTLSLKIDGVKIDFFLPTSQEESDKNKIIIIDNIKYHHWKNIFDAKVRIGSQKHLSDLAGFTPFRKDFFLFDQSIYENVENLQKQLKNAKDSYTYLKDNWNGGFNQFYERMIDKEYQIKELEEKLKNIEFPLDNSKKLNIIGQRHYNFDFIQSKFNNNQYSSTNQTQSTKDIKLYSDNNLEKVALNYFTQNNIDFENSDQYKAIFEYFNDKNKAILAYYLTFSENFKKFYGNINSRKNLPNFIINSIQGNYSKNSILLDENNEPVIFYHGAGTKFDKFSKDYFLSGEGAMAYGAGFYATNFKPTADNYRDTSKAAYETFKQLLKEENQELLKLIKNVKVDITEANINLSLQPSGRNIFFGNDIDSRTKLLELLGLTETKALYISLTNPLYWQQDISQKNKDIIEQHFNIKLKNTNSGQIYRELERTLKITDKEVSARLYQIGIDGVINITHGGKTAGGFSHIKGEKHVIFFEPVQAKSINNSGLFSLNNENMYDPIEITENQQVFQNKFELNLTNENLPKKSKELQKLPSNQWFNRTIQPIINRFSKMFPNVRSVVISEKEIPSEVKSIVNGLDKQINSFFHKGQVYIIKERVTKDIAIEEFLHPFVNALEQDNPELYKSLLLEAKKIFPELKEDVFTKYDKVYNSIFDKNREFLTQALTQKVSEQTPEQETFFQKFKTWIRDILNRLFGNEATTREISMLDETMSLTDLASILNENNTQFNFNSDTNTTYYSLNEEEINNYLNRPKNQIQAELLDKILENNKVTQTDFTGNKHEYTRNELGEILQLKPVSSFLSKKINPELDFSNFAQIGNAIHEIVKNINLNLLPRTQLIDTYAEKSDLKKILVDEKGYPIETVKQILSNIYDYVTPLIGSKESLLVSEVSISALQDLGDHKGVAGTIDLLEITKTGDLIIHDFKSMYLNGLETIVYSNNPSTQLTNKFNDSNTYTSYREQLSLYAKMLKGLVGNKNITLQIVPIGYLATSETKDKTIKVNFSDRLVKTDNSLMVENYIYSPFTLINVSKQQTKFQVPYFKAFADKILPSIVDKEEKKITKEEIDRQELLNNLTDKIKGENSKSFEAEIEKVFKQVTTIVTQYGNSQNELNKELFKLFDPKGELKETKSNFEAIFETIKEMGEDNPEKLKHYLSTLVQYINYIEETNVGLSNIKSHFYKIVANDANLDNQTLISDMRRSYLLAKSHKERINSILIQLGDIKEDNVFKQMLRKSTSYVDEIENLYFEKSLPLIANVLNSYFGKEFRDNMTKEVQDRLNKEKYDLNLVTSDNAKIRINNKILKLEEQLKMIPNPNLITDVIQGKYGDSDWFYSNLMANINNPDYVISGTESFMTDIMRDLSLIAIKQEEEFARQFSKREDTLKVNRDQVKEMNKDLVYASNHLVKKVDGTTEVFKSMTLLTEVNEDVYFDYEVLQNDLLKTEPNTAERKIISDKIKQFENEHFESEFNPKYLKALSAIDVIVSDGRNVKQVRQTILDKIKVIKVSNYKLNYLQGELESEDDLIELRELWREFINLSSTVDRNGNKKTGADLEIANILQARKKELEEFRDKKVDEDLWKKLKAKKVQSLLGKYNTEEEVFKSEEYKKWQSFNSIISPTPDFYKKRKEKLDKINAILDKKEYKDISLAGQLKDNLNQSWEKLNALSREYRDFEREFISQDIPEGSKKAMKILEENIDKVKIQIKGLEKSLSKDDKKTLNNLWEDYNSMVEYKTSKYYEEDLEIALNKYALENEIEVSELRNDSSLMTQFRLNSEWYINNHITKERYDKASGETIKYTEPVYYYKVVVPTNSDYIKETPAFQYSTFELKPEAYNLDEDGNPNYLDVFGRKKVKKSSKYITENIPYLKIKNDLSPKGRVNFENLQFLKKEMEEAQKGLNKQNYLYYQIPANRKSTFERVSEGNIKGVKQNLKDKFSINPQDETELGTRGVLANLSGEEAKFIPVLGKSKIDFNDQSYNIWKSILDYTLSAQKAKMFEERLPIFDVLVDQLEKNLPAVDGNKNEAIGESMSKKFNLENVKEVIKGRGDKRVQAVKDTVARYVYEEFTKELANIGGVSDIKLTNTLLGYSGATMMVGNIPNWIVNTMSGNIQLMIEAAGKRYFTSTDLKNAKIELAKRHKDAITDYTKTHDKSLFGQMIEYFDPVKGEFMDNLGNKFDWSKRTNLKQFFFSGKIYGEWEMQMTTFIAMLKAKKVTQIINGVEKTIDLYDAFEKGKDGVPKLKEGVQISDRELREYMTRIQGVNKLLNGSYAKLDQTKIEKYSLGRMAIFMKKFFIPLFVNRLGKFRGDSELQDVREGHYISFYNTIVKDMFNLPIGEIYAKMKKSPEDGGYTDLQKTAIIKTFTEIAFITALTISLVMLGYDDDEDDSDAKKFAQYIALKLRREVATFTPVAAPQEFASFFSRPFAAMSSTGNLINLGGMVLKTPINIATGAFEDDLYYQRKTSMWDAGDSKFLALLYKSMGLKLNIAHPDQLLQGYNYSIRL